MTGWAPDLGCLLNCSIFDTGCFPGAVFTAIDVCSDGEPGDNNGGGSEPTTTTTSSAPILMVSSPSTVALFSMTRGVQLLCNCLPAFPLLVLKHASNSLSFVDFIEH